MFASQTTSIYIVTEDRASSSSSTPGVLATSVLLRIIVKKTGAAFPCPLFNVNVSVGGGGGTILYQ
jgi:hypothetical protein